MRPETEDEEEMGETGLEIVHIVELRILSLFCFHSEFFQHSYSVIKFVYSIRMKYLCTYQLQSFIPVQIVFL